MELSIIKYPSAGSRASSGRRRSSTACLSVVLFLALLLPAGIHGHGRLIQPPSRSSAWRFKFPTPANYNDHEIYCGGFARQWSVNGGKCGPCGDPWDQPQPRDNEGGGKYGLGVITATYQEAAEIDIGVELTASHMGFFEFRVCPHNSPKTPVSQACLDKYPLQRSDGSGIRFYPKKPEKYYIRYVLPKDVTCKQCVLQWRYVAGNNWGNCPNGTGMVGCGPQEEFRSCSDITITRSDGTAASTPLPVPPGVHDEDYNEIEDDEIEVDKNVSLDKEANTSYVGHVVALTVAAILVPSIITATIIYFYCSRELVRNTFRRQSRLCRTFEGLVRNRQARIHTPDDAIKKDPGALEAQVPEMPVPPPRRHRSASITPAVSGRMEPSPGIPV